MDSHLQVPCNVRRIAVELVHKKCEHQHITDEKFLFLHRHNVWVWIYKHPHYFLIYNAWDLGTICSHAKKFGLMFRKSYSSPESMKMSYVWQDACKFLLFFVILQRKLKVWVFQKEAGFPKIIWKWQLNRKLGESSKTDLCSTVLVLFDSWEE